MVFNKIKGLFQKMKRDEISPQSKSISSINESPLPSFNETIEIDSLNCFQDEIVKVIYSKDKLMRYIILKKENGLYTYILERIEPYDEDEWEYLMSGLYAIPAMWILSNCSFSFFQTEDDAIKELKFESEYKQYFE